MVLGWLMYILSGVPSAVPVNSIIVYSCPAGHVFEHNTYGEPRWLIRCVDDGRWTTGDFWPKCINLSESPSLKVSSRNLGYT